MAEMRKVIKTDSVPAAYEVLKPLTSESFNKHGTKYDEKGIVGLVEAVRNGRHSIELIFESPQLEQEIITLVSRRKKDNKLRGQLWMQQNGQYETQQPRHSYKPL